MRTSFLIRAHLLQPELLPTLHTGAMILLRCRIIPDHHRFSFSPSRSQRLISRESAFCTLSIMNDAQRARMMRNREQALHRLHSSRFMTNKPQHEICRLCLQSGGQLAGRRDVVDFFNVQRATASLTPVRSFQETRGMHTEYTFLNKEGNLLGSQDGNHTLTQKGQEVETVPTERMQQFDYVVVIDFEATCDRNMQILRPQEIIEFPSVLVNCRCLTVEDCFQTYVKPVHNPILTDFCTRLTGIQQEQVDNGIALVEALDMHDKWLEEKGVKEMNFAVLIWSDWDCKVMLDSECRWKGLKKPTYFNRWINLKLLFQNAFMGRKCNLKKAVELAGLEWTGRAHCGLDDAKNTARLALELMRRGTILTFTGSLESRSDASPLILQAKIRRPHWPGTESQVISGGNDLQKPHESGSSMEVQLLCFCGVHSRKCIARKPGPMYGRLFFACGKVTVTDGKQCDFFQWAVADPACI